MFITNIIIQTVNLIMEIPLSVFYFKINKAEKSMIASTLCNVEND